VSVVHAVDLFAGAGGTSTGLALACKDLGREVELTAINHWQKAIDTHSANHPWAKHICQSVESVNPREVVPEGHLQILVASPECQHFSRAAGGRPKLDQRRASAWQVLRWLELLEVDSLLVENVVEFADWGPLDARGHPLRSKKGETFKAWVSAIRSLNYNADHRILNAADYGSPTSRKRLFVAARKGRKAVVWPEPTHSKKGDSKPKWRAAREIIDWSLKGQSIFHRKRPLSPNTTRRIIEGLKRFGGRELQPFIVQMEHGGGVDGIDVPLRTITGTRGGAAALVDPFILSQASGGAPRSVDDPVSTIVSDGAHALVEPFIVPFFGERDGQDPRVQSTEEPLAAVTSHGAGGLVEPYIVRFNGTEDAASEDSKRAWRNSGKSVDDPLPAVTGRPRFGLAEPFLLPVRGFFGQNTAKSVDDPLGTVTQRGYGGVVEPFILSQGSNGAPRSVEEPVPAILTAGKHALIESCLVKYNGRSVAQSIDVPLGTISTHDRFGLVQPVVDGKVLDIRFRMLQPCELAGAMGFPKSYIFSGPKTDVVKQIGNAVAVDVARALCRSLLDGKNHHTMILAEGVAA
jgi:DNA (cytosine-5)-methyltransferase 1